MSLRHYIIDHIDFSKVYYEDVQRYQQFLERNGDLISFSLDVSSTGRGHIHVLFEANSPNFWNYTLRDAQRHFGSGLKSKTKKVLSADHLRNVLDYINAKEGTSEAASSKLRSREEEAAIYFSS